MSEKLNVNEFRSELANFYGSETVYRHGLNRNVLYTEGVKFFAEKAECYWLLDIIATEPAILKQMKEGGTIIWLTVRDNNQGHICAASDSDEPHVFERHLHFTDAPEGAWKFYFFNNVIMLPSEY